MDHIDNNRFHSHEYQIPGSGANAESVAKPVETNIPVEEDNTDAEQIDVHVNDVSRKVGHKAFRALEMDGFKPEGPVSHEWMVNPDARADERVTNPDGTIDF